MPNEVTYNKYKADSEKLAKILDYIKSIKDDTPGDYIITNILRINMGMEPRDIKRTVIE